MYTLWFNVYFMYDLLLFSHFSEQNFSIFTYYFHHHHHHHHHHQWLYIFLRTFGASYRRFSDFI
jgi:hypothetical protein